MIDKLPLLHEIAKRKKLNISPPKNDDDSKNHEILEFSSLINEAQEHLKFIEKKNDELIALKNEVEITIDSKQQNEISEKINKIITEVQTKQNKLKNIIDYLNEQLPEINYKEKITQETRIKQILFGALRKKYQDNLITFNTIENEIKNIIQNKMIRGAEIALGRDLNDNEKNDILNEPNKIQKIYEKELTGAAPVTLLNAVSDLEERHKEIKNLETSIIQLHNLIMELNQLVRLQGQIIDNIEQNIKQAKKYVLEAEENIKKSLKNLIKAHKDKYIIIIIVIIALLVIIIPSFIYSK